MISILKRFRSERVAVFIAGGFAVLYVVITVIAMPHYVPWTSVNFILGLIGLPVTIVYSPPSATSFRFYPVCLSLALFALFFPDDTIAFVAFVTAIICVAEQIWQRFSLLSLLTISFMSSSVQYLAGVFSFPLRLSLTKIAADLLKVAGTDIVAEGNMMILGSRKYSVDPACMGVKMLLTSLLCGLFITAIVQRRLQRYLEWYTVGTLLVIVFILNLAGNIVRILTLVYFDIRPGTTMHEVTGLLCLFVYVLVPVTGLISSFIGKYGKESGHRYSGVAREPIAGQKLLLNVFLCVILLSSVLNKSRAVNTAQRQPFPIEGYKAAYNEQDVLQYSKSNVLVYVKKVNSILEGEHNPIMCWLGTGYSFDKINEVTVKGCRIYMAGLIKGREHLYTAWWYDNGIDRTTGYFQSRWNVLRGGKHYSIINVTTGTQEMLGLEVSEIMDTEVFKPLL